MVTGYKKLIALAFMSSATPVFAQTAASSASPVSPEEITVTARRGNEKLMDVPAGISVITKSQLETKQVANLVDIGRITPSLQVFEGVNQAQFGITMRGIPTVQGAEPSVAMVVDGIQTPGLTFFSQDLEGAESIEVLRGPQGALYGRGAIAGVIVINTKRPTNDFEGDVRLLAGNGDTQKASATISGPIVRDRLLFKLSGGYNHFGGLVENVGYHDKADSSRSWNARGELLFTPTDRTRIALKGDYSELDAIGNDWEVVGRSQLNDYSILPNFNVKPNEHRWLASGSAKLEQETDFGTFLSISQYSRTEDIISGDADFSPANLFLFGQTIDTKAFNTDFRFSSPQDNKFSWTVGAFYQWRVNDMPLLVTGAPGSGFDGAVLLNSAQFDRSRTYAAYGQAKLNLGDWDLNFALRYDIEKRLQLDRNLAGSTITDTFKALQPQASITRRFSDQLTAYASYGRGFRSGGFNAAADVLVPRPTAPYPVSRTFPKELADNFEIGFKSQFFDHKLSLNVSAYHTVFKNQQYFFFFLLPAPARDIVTVPKSTVTGLEVEGSFTPVTGLRIDFGMALTDAKVRDAAFYGNNIANVYRHTFNLGGEYSFPVTNNATFSVRADYQRLGPLNYDLQNTYLYKGTDLLSARASMKIDKFELAVFGRNLLDVRFPANFIPDGLAQDVSIRRRMTPRTYGIETRMRF